jgi:hypothetical protein
LISTALARAKSKKKKFILALALAKAVDIKKLDLSGVDIYADLPDYNIPTAFTANLSGHDGHWNYERAPPEHF